MFTYGMYQLKSKEEHDAEATGSSFSLVTQSLTDLKKSRIYNTHRAPFLGERPLSVHLQCFENEELLQELDENL